LFFGKDPAPDGINLALEKIGKIFHTKRFSNLRKKFLSILIDKKIIMKLLKRQAILFKQNQDESECEQLKVSQFHQVQRNRSLTPPKAAR